MSRKRVTLLDILVGVAVGILVAFAILMILVVGFMFWYGIPPGAIL